MIIIDDEKINDDDLKNLNEEITGYDFPWFYHKFKVLVDDGFTQFTHCFFSENQHSNYFRLIEPVLNKLPIKKLIKAKVNLQVKDNSFQRTPFHTDFGPELNRDLTTSILYLNTNNGKTVFENQQEVNSVKGRIVTFPCHLKHAAISHTDKDIRIVLNLNYYTKA